MLRVLWEHSVFEPCSQRVRVLQKEQCRWAVNGWRASHSFFSYTRGFPFEDYSASGASADRSRMANYRKSEVEPSRTKKQPIVFQELAAPSCVDACRALSGTVGGSAAKKQNEVSSNALLEIASATFGVRRKRSIKGRPDIPPLLRKTSPSGGCRHPTEGYLFLLQDQHEMPKGVYHFSNTTHTLDLFASVQFEREIRHIFDGNFRAQFDPVGVWVLTSIFERNRYRYREPRTFRSVYMDVGHILETLMLACEAKGLKTYPHHGFDLRVVEERIGIKGSDEAAIMACAFGTSHDH